MDKEKIKFTKHMVKRYLERYRGKKFPNMQKFFKYYYKDEKEINDEIRNKMKNASEESSYLTDTEFMTYMYERYGYDYRYHFLLNDKLIFVIIETIEGLFAVTCVDVRMSKVRNTALRPKYSKKKKKI